MKQITLALSDVILLYNELNGFTNQKGEQILEGFINQKLQISTKYWLSKLSKNLKKEVDLLEEMRKELINKYGEEDEEGGGRSIKIYNKDGKKNPNLEKFGEEYNKLLEIEKEIEYRPIPMDEVKDLKTEDNYSVLFTLFDSEDSE